MRLPGRSKLGRVLLRATALFAIGLATVLASKQPFVAPPRAGTGDWKGYPSEAQPLVSPLLLAFGTLALVLALRHVFRAARKAWRAFRDRCEHCGAMRTADASRCRICGRHMHDGLNVDRLLDQWQHRHRGRHP